MTEPELLQQGLSQLKIDYTENELSRLLLYFDELMLWKDKQDLLKATPSEIIIRHFLDSLAGLNYIRAFSQTEKIADIGSGAGFPGIPLALFLPKSEIILIERSSRKCLFLENTILRLGLKNVQVINADYKHAAPQFNLILCRAFSAINDKILRQFQEKLRDQGQLLFYKGKTESFQKELSVLSRQDFNCKIIKLEVPFLNAERHLIQINFD